MRVKSGKIMATSTFCEWDAGRWPGFVAKPETSVATRFFETPVAKRPRASYARHVMAVAYIALGSNLGEREATLHAALARINTLHETRVTKVSAFRETIPVDAPAGSPPFINVAAGLETGLSADELMRALLAIEISLGRDRAGAIPHAPRPIDLDLLLFADAVIETTSLTVPHPRIHQRLFVLQPLAEIAPDAMHPVLHKTIRELLQALESTL